MKIGIMQPYFFPYLGYFSLIKHTDKWVFFDTVQHIKKGWINRNRILKPKEGWQYIVIPVDRGTKSALIKDVLIDESKPWAETILAQLEHYKKTAPYYSDIIDFLENCFSYKTNKLSRLNIRLVENTCNYLEIDMNYTIFSEMDLELGDISGPGDWALRISQALGADTYINPPGGVEIFDKNKYRENGIDLQFLKVNLSRYTQKRSNFEEALSIIDVMMFNSIEEINKMLDNYEIFR
ncbi:WbqC-like protein family protein [Methanosarcina sp. Kolksee]|uniref:WbqC family protein n=1 Tax=Methanosarcina sp. Kolksee TaxID=1434099 RepID=UPI000615900E|nr:WbqC family protein [Methanosarcina sp. Kolksee]AKB46571.1 WbqC-like protein family protein [Methanosarcina sp. Kolksee]